VVARGLDLQGRTVRIKASAKGGERDALLAQALEHEVDHINGILYIDHLKSLDELVKISEEAVELEGRS
jgi:peptide deformylase